MKSTMLILLLIGGLGCGRAASSDSTQNIVLKSLNSAKTKVLSGVYQTSCVSSVQGGVKAYTKSVYTFSDLQAINIQSMSFSDVLCATPVMEESASGVYSVSVSGTELNYQFDHASLTPQTNEKTEEMNQAVLCGFSSWSTHVSKDVFGKGKGCFSATETDWVSAGDDKLSSITLYYCPGGGEISSQCLSRVLTSMP